VSINYTREITRTATGKKLFVYTGARKTLKDLYSQKLVTAVEAVSSIKSGDNVVLPLGCGEPTALVDAMAGRSQDLRDVKVHQMFPLRKASYMDKNMAESFRHVSWFTSGSSRQAVNEGLADFMPGHFHDYPRVIREYLKVDVFMGTVSPMDDRGYFSLGLSVDYTSTAATEAEIVILEVNPNMPRTRGESLIHISEADFIVHNSAPIPEIPIPPTTETDSLIAHFWGQALLCNFLLFSNLLYCLLRQT